jgi:hypothetical protein
MKKSAVKKSTFSLSEGKAEGKPGGRAVLTIVASMISGAYECSGGLLRENLSAACNL